MENAAQKVKCPACGCADAYHFTVKNGYRLHRSQKCGLVFVWPTPSNTTSVYDEDYFHGATHGFGYADYDRDKEPQRKTMGKYLDVIAAYCSGVRLLDVGAAQGNFLQLAAKRGWKIQGVEISEYAVAVARQRGMPVIGGTVHHSDLQPGSFDVVTLWDVLEHLPDPIRDILMIHALLKPGGIIAINTPDSGSWWARFWGSHWHMIVPPEHLNLFSVSALSIILENSGFKIEKVAKIGKSFSVPYILSVLHGWTGKRFLATMSAWSSRMWLRRVAFPINLRDNMFFIARKQ